MEHVYCFFLTIFFFLVVSPTFRREFNRFFMGLIPKWKRKENESDPLLDETVRDARDFQKNRN